MTDDDLLADLQTDDDQETGDRPVFQNRDEGVAVWLNTDKNGDGYLSIRLPLGLGYVNVFAVDDDLGTVLKQYKDQRGDS